MPKNDESSIIFINFAFIWIERRCVYFLFLSCFLESEKILIRQVSVFLGLALKFLYMVIQRWQSVMLLIAAVMMGLFSFLSLGQIQMYDYCFNITALGILHESLDAAVEVQSGVYTYVAFTISVLASLIALLSIFCYKNKKLHKKTVVFSMLFTVLSVALVAYNVYDFSMESGDVQWNLMISTPIVALIAEIFAYRMISFDWKKIEAADRLR